MTGVNATWDVFLGLDPRPVPSIAMAEFCQDWPLDRGPDLNGLDHHPFGQRPTLGKVFAPGPGADSCDDHPCGIDLWHHGCSGDCEHRERTSTEAWFRHQDLGKRWSG